MYRSGQKLGALAALRRFSAGFVFRGTDRALLARRIVMRQRPLACELMEGRCLAEPFLDTTRHHASTSRRASRSAFLFCHSDHSIEPGWGGVCGVGIELQRDDLALRARDRKFCGLSAGGDSLE